MGRQSARRTRANRRAPRQWVGITSCSLGLDAGRVCEGVGSAITRDHKALPFPARVMPARWRPCWPAGDRLAAFAVSPIGDLAQGNP
jgi:hypothetical protein